MLSFKQTQRVLHQPTFPHSCIPSACGINLCWFSAPPHLHDVRQPPRIAIARRFHKGAAFLQGIAAAAGLLGLVADPMRQRCFDQLARMTGFISGPIAEAGSETMNVLGLHAAQHHFRRHVRQRFVARLLGKANSFSRWRRITSACGDIIHTRTRRMFALLLATHRGKKAGCKSSTSNHRPMICFSGRFYFLW